MTERDEFETRLVEALRREAARTTLRLDAAAVLARASSTKPRTPSWLLPVAAPIAGALVLGAIILIVFPGPSSQPPHGASPTASTAPVVSPSASDPSASRRPQPSATPHPTTRSNAGWVAHDGMLYVVGGLVDGSPTSWAHVFDGAVWRSLPSLPEPRVGSTAVVLGDGSLVVAGGRVDDQEVSSVLRLDADRRQWIEMAPLPQPRAFMAGATVDGRIYLIGGAGSQNSYETLVFDPAEASWSLASPIPDALSHSAAAVADDSIYVVGGATPEGTETASVFRYLPGSDRWERLSDVPVSGSSAAATMVETSDGWELWLIGPRSYEESRFGEIPVYATWEDSWRFSPGASPVGAGQGLMTIVQPSGDILVLGKFTATLIQTSDR